MTDISIMKNSKQHHEFKSIKKIRSNNGMTMVELLCATLILLLVSSGMVTGVQLAQRQYFKSIRDSEAQILFNTIQSVLTNELRYTTRIHYSDDPDKADLDEFTKAVDTFYSVTFAIKNHETALVALNQEEQITKYGELALGYNGEYNKILGSAAYPRGLGADAQIYYNEKDKLFTVCLTIALNDQPYLEAQTFQVRALNKVECNGDNPGGNESNNIGGINPETNLPNSFNSAIRDWSTEISGKDEYTIVPGSIISHNGKIYFGTRSDVLDKHTIDNVPLTTLVGWYAIAEYTGKIWNIEDFASQRSDLNRGDLCKVGEDYYVFKDGGSWSGGPISSPSQWTKIYI